MDILYYPWGVVRSPVFRARQSVIREIDARLRWQQRGSSKPSTPNSAGELGDDERAALVRGVLARIGDKWSVIILCQLGIEPRRFNELRRLSGGITQRMLSSTLRNLERDGIVSRTVHPSVPPQVEYSLTSVGRSLLTIVQSLAAWTNDNLDFITTARQSYDARTKAEYSDP